jgi:hypothetical protein
MASNSNYLKHLGLTNGLFDYADLIPSNRREAKAYCTSDKCCIENGRREFHKVQRSVEYSATECPYCKHALIWIR